MAHPKNEDIYIVGSGAIGKALAVFLKRENKNVRLVRGSLDDLPKTENEVTVIVGDETFKERITTITFSHISAIHGIVLVTTKTFANAQMAKKLNAIGGDFSIVLLQNGLNIDYPFERFRSVFRCVLFSTSQVTGDSEVTFKSVTASPIGNITGTNEGLQNLIGHLNTPQFEFRGEPDILKYVWNKTITNCVFNTICPLLEIDNGIFHRNSEAKGLAQKVIAECVLVAGLQGILLDKDEIIGNLVLISEKSDGQLISTYMDILNKRPTEIESLNLEIAKIADEIGRPEVVQTTRILGQLIQIKSTIQA
ncbi:MAG: 2-dehydropantoate 2-reductase [Bacteroidota bacterium]